MKEEDLYEIGNRLYHHESDPPSDGWRKIAGAINTPKGPAPIRWSNKLFWIPLAMLVSVSLFFLIPQREESDTVITQPVYVGTVGEPRVLAPADQPNRPSSTIGEAVQDIDPRAKTSDKNKPTIIQQNVIRSNRAIQSLKFPAAAGATAVEATSESETQDKASLAFDKVENSPITSVRQRTERILQTEVPTISEVKSLSQGTTVLPGVISEVREEDEKGEQTEKEMRERAWRLNLSLTPGYAARSLRPISDDEVFVTKMESDDRRVGQRITPGFAIGAGKAVAKDLYLDVHLTFSQSKQTTFFSYATGKIDTLLAVQQPDQSVRVIPVYAENHREMKSRYTYGGLRIGATYAFLSMPRGRFHLLAAAGINYLVSADVRERVDGQWTALSNDNLNKLNYTFSVGAGYSWDLDQRWTLMINPVLTYNLRQVKNAALPYRLNQRPVGLNIMLSRKFGRF